MLVSFVACMKILLTSNSAVNRRPFKALLTVAILMAILDAMHEILQLQHILAAFIFYKGPGGALAQLSDTAYWSNQIKTVIYVLQTLLGDGVLVSQD